jgi:hypothetical protein
VQERINPGAQPKAAEGDSPLLGNRAQLYRALINAPTRHLTGEQRVKQSSIIIGGEPRGFSGHAGA